MHPLRSFQGVPFSPVVPALPFLQKAPHLLASPTRERNKTKKKQAKMLQFQTQRGGGEGWGEGVRGGGRGWGRGWGVGGVKGVLTHTSFPGGPLLP